MQKLLGLAAVVLLVAGVWYASEKAPPPELDINELGVVLDLGERSNDYSYTTRTVQGVGTVAFVSSPLLTPAAEACELGALYRLKKEGFEQYRTRWTEETLKLAAEGGDIPPQVKEFDDSYLIFEPSQAVCTSDQGLEVELRSALLDSIGEAKSTQ
jgi:hypothetical protein